MTKRNEDNFKKKAENGWAWISGHSEELALAAAAASHAMAKKQTKNKDSEPLLKGMEIALDKASTLLGDVAEKAELEAVEKGESRSYSATKLLVAGIAVGFVVGFIARRGNDS